jgi:hypothetical protein
VISISPSTGYTAASWGINNNIYYNVNGSQYLVVDANAPGITASSWFAASEPNGSISMPVFVDPANGNFHLSSTDITARNKGFNLSSYFSIDHDGNIRSTWDIGAYEYTGSTGVASDNVPRLCILAQNYPNPFNPSTTIAFAIPVKSQVTLKIFDILGREIATLMNNEIVAAGNHTKQWNAANMPSGVYFYKLQARSFTATKKLVLMK